MARYLQRDADFALDADLGDEDLPLPRDLDRPWVQKGRRPAAVLLVLLAAGAVTLRVAGSHSPSTPVADPSSDPARIRDVSQPLRHVASGLVSDDLIAACPATASCRTSTRLPDPIVAALHATFPGYTEPSARTVTVADAGHTRLLGRFVHVVTTTADVTVQVLPRRLPASTMLTGTGSAAIVVVQRSTGTATVRVTVGGPGASQRAGSPPLRLAADPRLLVP